MFHKFSYKKVTPQNFCKGKLVRFVTPFKELIMILVFCLKKIWIFNIFAHKTGKVKIHSFFV